MTSNLEDSRNVRNKLSWTQNLKGQYYLEKDSISAQEKIQERKTSIHFIKKDNPDDEIIKVIDNTEKFKVDMVVMTEWGLGKIIKISQGIASIKIEGTDVDFPLMSLNTMITIYLCILSKETTSWAEIKIPFDYLVHDLKTKIARITNSHHSQVLLVHNGAKIQKNVNIFELGIYEKDTFLVIIKDPREIEISRCISYKTASNQNIHNALRLKVNQNVILTAMGLMKNNFSDVLYHLMVFEEEIHNSNLKLVFSQKQVNVSCMASKDDNPIYKHKIANLEIRKGIAYQIHQYMNRTDNNQNICVKCIDDLEERQTGVIFSLSDCEIQGKENATNIEEGLIPSIYYTVTPDN